MRRSPIALRCGSASGLLAGVAVLYLSQDRLELTDKVHYSFAMIPMILVTFFGGGISGLVSFCSPWR